MYDEKGKLICEGDYVDGLDEGNGKSFNENDYYYIGQFKSGNACGKGIQYDKDGNILYEGDWANDLSEGTGKLILDDGLYFIGEFKMLIEMEKENFTIKIEKYYTKGFC